MSLYFYIAFEKQISRQFCTLLSWCDPVMPAQLALVYSTPSFYTTLFTDPLCAQTRQIKDDLFQNDSVWPHGHEICPPESRRFFLSSVLSIIPESGGCDGVKRRRLLALGVVTPLLECVRWNTNIHVNRTAVCVCERDRFHLHCKSSLNILRVVI